MKVLIVSPEIHRLGGVANHYLGLSPHWTIGVRYLFYGKRNDNTPVWLTILLYPYDFVRFFLIVLFDRGIDIVLINPSLRKFQIIRDGMFLLVARLCGKKVVTFIHGFDIQLGKKLAHHKSLFQWCYNKSLYIYVLYSGFKDILIDAGIKVPIELTTTKVSNELLCEVKIKESIKTLLFVGRINKEKGIYESINTYAALKKTHPELRFVICGDGPIINNVKSYVTNQRLSDVEFRGNITGDQLRNAYLEGDLYILPTYGEGMATTILEAMAFGLPVISSPVGGVVDFWTDDMGTLIPAFDYKKYANVIEQLLNSPARIKAISQNNIDYAREHFLADKVAKRIEGDLKKYCGNI